MTGRVAELQQECEDLLIDGALSSVAEASSAPFDVRCWYAATLCHNAVNTRHRRTRITDHFPGRRLWLVHRPWPEDCPARRWAFTDIRQQPGPFDANGVLYGTAAKRRDVDGAELRKKKGTGHGQAWQTPRLAHAERAGHASNMLQALCRASTRWSLALAAARLTITKRAAKRRGVSRSRWATPVPKRSVRRLNAPCVSASATLGQTRIASCARPAVGRSRSQRGKQP